MHLKPSEAVQWFLKYGLNNSLPNVPRIDQLELLATISAKDKEFNNNLFGNEGVVMDLMDSCKELYDMAFVIEQFARIQGSWTGGMLIHKVHKRFGDFFDGNADV